ncbi:MAG: site-specific integrase [Actinomycetota bacterium]|nr:site-specific integrase [Actinomycetota bacterium]
MDAYRYDLRAFFQWAADEGLVILSATRPQVELYARAMERRGLAATTIDRRLSTVCGFYRFAHIDGRIASNPAQYVRRPKVHPNDARGLDRSELGVVSVRRRAGRPRPCRTWRAPRTERPAGQRGVLGRIENLGFERGHRTLRIVGKGTKPAVIPLVPRTARTIDLAIGERTAGPILLRHNGSRLDRRTAHRWGPLHRQASGLGQVHPHMLRAAFIMCALEAGVPLREVQIAARHADPRTTTVYDHRRQSFDKHAAYVVVAFVAGG